MAAAEVRCFGIEPKIALMSHSNSGTSNAPSAQKVRDVLSILRQCAPQLQVDGEIRGGLARDANLRRGVMPDSTLEGDANPLVLPYIHAVNISYNLLKTAACNNGAIGSIQLGCRAACTCAAPFRGRAPDRQCDGIAGGGCGCGQVAARLEYESCVMYALCKSRVGGNDRATKSDS